ncbi:hypothetical protein D3C75_1205520 [compost metagenome]
MAEAPARVRPATTAKMVAKATAERNPKNKLPPTAWAKCIATMLLPPTMLPPSLPSTKYWGSVPTITIAAKPSMQTTRKKKPMKPDA